MEFKQCQLCGRYGFTDTHKCPPQWAVFLYDEPGPAVIHADKAEDACAQYAIEHDNGDYHLLNGGELTVAVATWSQWKDRSDNPTSDDDADMEHAKLSLWIRDLPHYTCTAQLVPEYSANLVKK